MKRIGSGLLVLVALAVSVAETGAAVIDATVTADNHYVLYYGKEDGSQLVRVGRNELGAGGSSGDYNWSVPEDWNFSTPDYIYVAAWDDGLQQGWIGDFQITRNEKSILSLSVFIKI